MLLFDVCKCPKCGSRFLPDAEATFSRYFDAYAEKFPSIVTENLQPPELPDFLIFRCSLPGCLYTEQVQDTEVLERIKRGWAELAWQSWQTEMKKSFNFDKYFTRYLLDESLGKFVTEDELKHNPLLRDYVRLIKDGRAKPTEEV